MEDMNIVIVGHVDHGKSTVIGRLLADTGTLPEGKLEQIKEKCRRNSKPFEYAFLLDALKDEQAQGITIDAARCFFKSKKRNYIIIDAPGHIEFLKNMVTGASRADAAVLVIDANEGVQENSRRHGYLLGMLGIKQVTVLVNKMDLVDYDKKVFESIVEEYTSFLQKISIKPKSFVPVSGMQGDGIVSMTSKIAWYSGPTVLDSLDQFENSKLPENASFRMPVQDIYKFTKNGDDRRLIVGTIESGKLNVGDEIVFYPSGKKSTVKTIEVFNAAPVKTQSAGCATAFTVEEQIYIKRGELASVAFEAKPKVSSRMKVNLFWLGRVALCKNKKYLLKIGSAKVDVWLEDILSVVDASSLDSIKKDVIDRHDVAECILKTSKAIAFDVVSEGANTSRFVLIDDYEIAGGGIICEALEDKQTWVREKVLQRNYKWESSSIASEVRANKYNQKSTLVLITGDKDSGKKTLAKALEQKLFDDGKFVYFMGIGNVLYGVDADIKEMGKPVNRQEHLRRLGEVSNLLLDAGMIAVVTAIGLNQEDLEIIKASVPQDCIVTVWLGSVVSTDIKCDLHVYKLEDPEKEARCIEGMLQDKGVIFRPF